LTKMGGDKANVEGERKRGKERKKEKERRRIP
jgi:hypothetical protein